MSSEFTDSLKLQYVLRDNYYSEHIKCNEAKLPLNTPNIKHRQTNNDFLPYTFYPFENSRAFWAILPDSDENRQRYINFLSKENVRHFLIFCDTKRLQKLYTDIVSSNDLDIQILVLKLLCVILTDNLLESFPFYKCAVRLAREVPPNIDFETKRYEDQDLYIVFYNGEKLLYCEKDYVLDSEIQLNCMQLLLFKNFEETYLGDDIYLYESILKKNDLVQNSEDENSFFKNVQKLTKNFYAPNFANQLSTCISNRWSNYIVNPVVRFSSRQDRDLSRTDLRFCSNSNVSKFSIVGYFFDVDCDDVEFTFTPIDKKVRLKSVNCPNDCLKLSIMIFPQNLRHVVELKSFEDGLKIRELFRTELMTPLSGLCELDELIQCGCYYTLLDYNQVLRSYIQIILNTNPDTFSNSIASYENESINSDSSYTFKGGNTGTFDFLNNSTPESHLLDKEVDGVKFKTNGVQYLFNIQSNQTNSIEISNVDSNTNEINNVTDQERRLIFLNAIVALKDFFNMNKLVVREPLEQFYAIGWGEESDEDARKFFDAFAVPEDYIERRHYKSYNDVEPKNICYELIASKCCLVTTKHTVGIRRLTDLDFNNQTNNQPTFWLSNFFAFAEYVEDPEIYCCLVKDEVSEWILYKICFKRKNKRLFLALPSYDSDFCGCDSDSEEESSDNSSSHSEQHFASNV